MSGCPPLTRPTLTSRRSTSPRQRGDAASGICAGVDGCKAGWVAAIRTADGSVTVQVFAHIAAWIDALPDGATVAVDMPIGLPERVGRGGRGPEALIRPLLGQRQSSVFSIPSRAALYAETDPFGSLDEWYAAHRRASDVARATSDPPRAISIQAFGIFGKIRELDAMLRARPGLCDRVIESHPELAFRQFAGHAMRLPKKIKSRVNPAGMEERRDLLAAHGIPRTILDAPPPRGAAADDALDACAMLLVAERRVCGQAVSYPDPPGRDALGLPIAIWA